MLSALVGETLVLPDFLTPRPATFAPKIEDQLALVRATPLEVVRRDLLATHAPRPLPDALRRGAHDTALAELLACGTLSVPIASVRPLEQAAQALREVVAGADGAIVLSLRPEERCASGKAAR